MGVLSQLFKKTTTAEEVVNIYRKRKQGKTQDPDFKGEK